MARPSMPGPMRTFAAASLLTCAPFAHVSARALGSTFERIFPTLNVWLRQHRSSAKGRLRTVVNQASKVTSDVQDERRGSALNYREYFPRMVNGVQCAG